jgi:hypothetical protein
MRYDLRRWCETRIANDRDRLEASMDHSARHRNEPIARVRMTRQREQELVLATVCVAAPERGCDPDLAAVDNRARSGRRRSERNVDRAAFASALELRRRTLRVNGIEVHARWIDAGSSDDRRARRAAVTGNEHDGRIVFAGRGWLLVAGARHRSDREETEKPEPHAEAISRATWSCLWRRARPSCAGHHRAHAAHSPTRECAPYGSRPPAL